jgi:hypothetical protein
VPSPPRGVVSLMVREPVDGFGPFAAVPAVKLQENGAADRTQAGNRELASSAIWCGLPGEWCSTFLEMPC